MIYYLFFALFFLVGFLDFIRIGRTNREIIAIGTVIAMILFAGLRYHTGSDWTNYEERYNQILPIDKWPGSTHLNFEFEFGFEFLCAVIKFLGGGIQVILFIVPLFNVTFSYLFLRKYSPCILISLFIFSCTSYFQFDFAVLRQAIAFPIFLYSLEFLYRRRIKEYIVLILLAGMFHYSVLPLVILPVLRFERQISSIKAILIFCLGFIGMLFFSFKLVINLGVTLGVFPVIVSDKLINYMSDNAYGATRGISLGFFFKAAIFVLALLKRDFLKEKIENFNFVFNLYLIYCFLWMLMNDFDVILVRYSLYFQITQDLLLVYLIYSFKERIVKFLYYAVLITSINFYYYFGIVRSYQEAYFPYKSVLFKN